MNDKRKRRKRRPKNKWSDAIESDMKIAGVYVDNLGDRRDIRHGWQAPKLFNI